MDGMAAFVFWSSSVTEKVRTLPENVETTRSWRSAVVTVPQSSDVTTSPTAPVHVVTGVPSGFISKLCSSIAPSSRVTTTSLTPSCVRSAVRIVVMPARRLCGMAEKRRVTPSGAARRPPIDPESVPYTRSSAAMGFSSALTSPLQFHAMAVTGASHPIWCAIVVWRMQRTVRSCPAMNASTRPSLSRATEIMPLILSGDM
mmetsp:Transcript_5991/g.18913  ORF Transcript_5991/g.18913 Transcript_5991/m.18913 type:complete len:201 (-) Transcript_5991:491-1093(-)